MRFVLYVAFLVGSARVLAAEVFVSPAGSHSAPYATWETASTNVEAGLAALGDGDTLTLGPGTYVVPPLTLSGTNKLVRGGRGTLLDADRTLLVRGSGNSVLSVDGVRCRVAGVTVSGGPPAGYAGGVFVGGTSNVVDSCVLRGNSSGGFSGSDSAVFRNCIVAGNSTGLAQQVNSAWAGRVERCVVEQNSSAQLAAQGWAAMWFVRASAVGHPSGYAFISSGCATNATTNGLGESCGYAGSSWTATGFAWGGVRSYVPTNRAPLLRATPAVSSEATSRDGLLGPAALPWDAPARSLEFDYSTNGNHGTLFGAWGAVASSPLGGAAAAFSRPWGGDARSNGFMKAAFVPGAMTNYPLTIEAWLSSTGASTRIAVSAWKAADWYTGWWLGLNAANKAYAGVGYGSGSYKDALSPGSFTGWVHVACAWASPTSMILYANGVPVATNAASGLAPPSLAELDIGRQPILIPGGYFGGTVSDVRIWSVARTKEQILDCYSRRLSGDEPGLEAYYRFDGGAFGSSMAPGPFNIKNPVLDPEGD